MPSADTPRPLKLVFLIKALGIKGGGAERVLTQVSSALVARGHDVTVISYDAEGTPDFYSAPASVKRIRLGLGRVARPSNLADTLLRMSALKRQVRRLKPDVAIGFMHSAFIPLGIALRGTGICVIGSEHIVYHHYGTRPLQRMLLNFSPRLCAAITAISESMRDSFPPAIRRKMVIIPNPVSTSRGALASVANGPRKTILSVGRLEEQKDHATLVDAFALVADRHPHWDLRIVGEGQLRPKLERQVAELELSGRVVLPGATAHIEREYLAAQLFAMPSRYESFGLATAEALAHGLPAVGFADCPGTNELIQHNVNGLLVGGVDRVAALAAGLTQLMSSSERRVKMAAAAPRSVDRFTVEPIVGKWETLLEQVAAGARQSN